ncbi:MAG: flagellar biosynthesis anti-sigma factor FlgM [Thiohalorhabdaceae bacterium]
MAIRPGASHAHQRRRQLQHPASRPIRQRPGQSSRDQRGRRWRFGQRRRSRSARPEPAKLDNLPEVRGSRVETLRDAIERGEYQVDGREVVGRVLRNVLLDNLK